MERLWKRYGAYLIGLAVAVVIGFAGWKYWDAQRVEERHAEGERFSAAAALLQQGKTEEAGALFAALAGETDSGYGMLARFNGAAIRARADDPAGAVQIYDAIAADESAPRSLRDLATVLSGLQALRVPSVDLSALEGKLLALTRGGSAFRHMAFEILALAAQSAGDVEKAKQNYKAIVDDAEAPQGIRSRASQMLAILDGA